MSRNNRTPRIARFHALLGEMNIRSQKSNLLAGYGVESTSDLTYEQLEELIASLEKGKAYKKEASKDIRKWRSVNLDLLTQMGIYDGSRNWDKVNQFLENPRIAGMRMYKMDLGELKRLASKLRAILEKDKKKKEIHEHQARNN